MTENSFASLPLLLGIGAVIALSVFFCWIAASDATAAEALADKWRSDWEAENARAIELTHEADYWRGLANWHSEHPGEHPSQEDCDRIAQQADKWLPVGTPASPVLTQFDGAATFSQISEFTDGADRRTRGTA